MKSMKASFSYKMLLLVSGVSLLSAIAPFWALAAEVRTGDQPSVSATENIAEDLYIAGGSVYSSGIVAGDILSAGGTVTVAGSTLGDGFLVGGNVSVLGDVLDDLRIIGGNITVNGSVNGDVAIAGGQIQLTGKSIGGDVIAGGGTVRLDAPVQGDIKIGGGNIVINSTIQGNAEIWANELSLGPNAVISGKLKYHAPKQITFLSGQVIGGTEFVATKDSEKQAKNMMAAIVSVGLVLKLLTSLICALFIGLVFKKFSSSTTRIALSSPLAEIGRGFLALVAIPIASILLMVTIVGLPFGFIGIFAYITLIISAVIFMPVLVGAMFDKYVWKNSSYVPTWQSILIGTTALFIVGLVPLFGWIICFTVFLLSLGGIVKGITKTGNNGDRE